MIGDRSLKFMYGVLDAFKESKQYEQYRDSANMFTDSDYHVMLSELRQAIVDRKYELADEAKLLRGESGVSAVSPLVSFLYELLRDHLPAGTVEQIKCRSVATGKTVYTNGYIASYASHLATRLTSRDHAVEPHKE